MSLYYLLLLLWDKVLQQVNTRNLYPQDIYNIYDNIYNKNFEVLYDYCKILLIVKDSKALRGLRALRGIDMRRNV